MKLLKMIGLLFIGMSLCLLVIVFIMLPSIFLIILANMAVDKGIIPNTPLIDTICGILALTFPFPMTILVQKIWKRLDPFFDKFDNF